MYNDTHYILVPYYITFSPAAFSHISFIASKTFVASCITFQSMWFCPLIKLRFFSFASCVCSTLCVCVRAYVCMYVHMCEYACIYVSICVRLYICIMCIYVCVICLCLYAFCICICVYACVSVYMCVYVCFETGCHVCMYLCVSVNVSFREVRACIYAHAFQSLLLEVLLSVHITYENYVHIRVYIELSIFICIYLHAGAYNCTHILTYNYHT